MSANVSIPLLATGVPGLDDILGGGIPEFSFNLIAGPPGSGKTTLAHQIMFALATPERPALYCTALGEPPLKMFRYQQQFGFFDCDAIGRSVHFVNLSEESLGGDLEVLLTRISVEVETHAPALVFIDSFRSVVLATQFSAKLHNGVQDFMQKLGTLMTSWQATTFLIGEYHNKYGPSPVFTVADGLLWLAQSVKRNSVVRKIDVVKMRGLAPLPGLHTFRIGQPGMEIFAPVRDQYPDLTDPRPEQAGSRVGTGVPELDTMLGGGLPRNYSLLVAGPSGSGKSILAAAFLAEGARLGETGVIAAFEQRPNRSRNRVVADLIANGQVGLVDSRAPDLSIDEIVKLLLGEIRRLKATRLVIDSLSGFELAIAPTFREDFRESLLRMVTALCATGVTVLMTSELEDRYNDLRFSPYGTAFLTDAIVLQRYIELDSRLRRAIAVVKVRASPHSDALRLFHIDDQGIHIDEKLSDQEGLLTGSPSHASNAFRSNADSRSERNGAPGPALRP